MKNNCLSLVLFLAFFQISYGQMDQYHAKRKLTGITAEWHRLVLPDVLFQHLNDGLSDLRIYGITENKDTVEASYLLERKEDELTSESIDFKLINQSKTGDGFYYTFELGDETEVNEIKINFSESNFDWRLNLEGSQDQKSWFTIEEDYRILSIENEITNYRFTDLVFPLSKYRYYRILVKSKTDPGLLSASVSMNRTLTGNYRYYNLISTKISTDKSSKQTLIDVELKQLVPLSKIKVWTSSPFDFYRPITLKYLADSVKAETGWIYTYQNLTSGILSSIENNTYNFQSTKLKKVQIVIDNGDNPELKIDSVSVYGFVHELKIRFTEDADYYLVYGNATASDPNYDIAHFQNDIPANLTELVLGEEELIEKTSVPVTEPLFKNKMWLWVIMGIIILVLGWFSLSMLKKKSGS
jgi:hypothetical protein